MSRLLTRAVRLLKFGAVAGVAVAAGRLALRHRRRPEAGESSWPTIAETAAQNGESVDEEADAEGDAGSAEAPSDDAEGASDDADKA